MQKWKHEEIKVEGKVDWNETKGVVFVVFGEVE